MFRQCRLPQPSPNPSSEWRKIPFSIEGYPMPQIVAFAGPSGPAFSFSAFLLPARPLVCVDGAGFLSSRFAAVLVSLTTGSHGPNRAGLLLRWRRSPTRPKKPHTGPHRAEFSFTDFSSRVFVLAEPQNPASGCNLPPLGWVILAKTFSLFSPPQILRWPSLSFGYVKGWDFSRTIHKNSIPDHIFFPLDKKKHRR